MGLSLETVPLSDTGRVTTRLGYGCSSLMGGTGYRGSMDLLSAAYDAGIRHFDVAPSYGFGRAEGALGDFLKQHPGATITTKYGIPPPRNQSLAGAARSLVMPVVKAIPGIKQRVAKLARAATRTTRQAPFHPAETRASLEHSLRELKTDRIDLFLLHEAAAEDLGDDSLLEFLNECLASGLIGSFGVGSGATKIPALYAERREYCRTMQFEWSVLDPSPEYPGSHRVHHRALFPLASIQGRLKSDLPLRRRWSDEVGMDLGAEDNLPSLMLKAALERNPGCVILFSSKKPENILANIAVLEDDKLREPALRLHALVQRDRSHLTQT